MSSGKAELTAYASRLEVSADVAFVAIGDTVASRLDNDVDPLSVGVYTASCACPAIRAI